MRTGEKMEDKSYIEPDGIWAYKAGSRNLRLPDQ